MTSDRREADRADPARPTRAERRRALVLCGPAVIAMVLVTAYPLAYALLLSVQRYDLRFPAERSFVGPSNYVSVLTSAVWWEALGTTVVITVASVAVEFVVAFGIAAVLHRAVLGHGAARASILVPFAAATVVAALAWRQAFDLGTTWSSTRMTGLMIIIATEVWRTTPLLALVLLAGMTLVPRELERAARVDGANALQRLVLIRLPLMRPIVLAALLFRALDTFRIFDTIWVQTGGAQDTTSVSVLSYETTVTRLNLGMGAAVSILLFLGAVGIVVAFIRRFGLGFANLAHQGWRG